MLRSSIGKTKTLRVTVTKVSYQSRTRAFVQSLVVTLSQPVLQAKLGKPITQKTLMIKQVNMSYLMMHPIVVCIGNRHARFPNRTFLIITTRKIKEPKIVIV